MYPRQFNYIGSHPLYRYDTWLRSCGGIVDDFGTLIPLSDQGKDFIFRGTLDIGY